MHVRHYTGRVVDVSIRKGKQLIASGSWVAVDKPAEKPVEAVEVTSESEDTKDAPPLPQEPSEPQEETKLTPTIPEMRAWALKEGIEGVKEKGKLPRHAVEAYLKAHENKE